MQSVSSIQKKADAKANDFPLVSVITVVFNGEKTIEKTIQSVISQDYPNVEYIIIDGKSTDNTVELIQKYDDHISYWRSEEDEGIYDAMNKGIAKSNGEIIHLLNADDTYVHEGVISAAVHQIGSYAYLSTRVNYLTFNRTVVLQMKKNNLASIPHPGLFVRRESYHENLFNLKYKYASDLDFILRIKDAKQVKKGDTISVNMVMGGIGSSKKCSDEATKIYIRNGYFKTLFLYQLKRIKFFLVTLFKR